MSRPAIAIASAMLAATAAVLIHNATVLAPVRHWTAEAAWMQGTPMPLRWLQTQLRDRYLQYPGTLPGAYSR